MRADRSPSRERLRRIATIAVFAVAVAATAATQPVMTNVDIASESGSLEVDAEHATAVSRIVVRLNPEATSTYASTNVLLKVDAIRRMDGAAGGNPAVRLVVTSGLPPEATSSGASPAVEEPRDPDFQEEVVVHQAVSLPVQCGIGPCERTFWLVAQLADPAAGRVTVDWHVEGRLTYGANWPSGAGGSIVLDPPIAVEGAVSPLIVYTEPEVLQLGPSRPAAARVVAVSLGAGAIPDDFSRVAILSVDFERVAGTGGGSPRQPRTEIYPLESLDPADPAGPLPGPLRGEPDPFEGCIPGEDCTRRFLVTIEWAADDGEDVAYNWGVTVRRTDLGSAWSTPASLTAAVERRFDLGDDAESETFHFEGVSAAVAVGTGPQVRIAIEAATTADDPILRLLPRPAVMTFHAELVSTDPNATPGPSRATARVSLTNGAQLTEGLEGDQLTLTANPLVDCRAGTICGDLEVEISGHRPNEDAPVPNLPFRWSLDLAIYAFDEAPMAVTVENLSTPAT